MAPSRTPQPAIDTGIAEIRITGGINSSAFKRSNGDPIALAHNQATKMFIE
jgi:hypothetical protein